jgi:hypothetical protein
MWRRLVRKVGVILVGLGAIGTTVGHYVAYNADASTHTAAFGIGAAAAAICLVILGLVLVQLR